MNFTLLTEYKEKIYNFFQKEFNYLRSFTNDIFTSFEEKSIVARGEILSTNMVVNYLLENGIKAKLINALDFMRTDKKFGTRCSLHKGKIICHNGF